MQATDLERLEKIAEGLSLLFYVLMFVGLVMALAGSAGSGFLLLVVGSCAHIGQAGIGEFVARERARGGRSEPQPRLKLERDTPGDRLTRPARALPHSPPRRPTPLPGRALGPGR